MASAGVVAMLALMERQGDTRVQPYFTGGPALGLSVVGHLRQRALTTRA
ncbi:hypothetical protein ACIQVL_45885 [Streptomyces sp. NPDC090499]